MELCIIIDNSIASHLLENVICGKVKIFNTNEYFNLSKEEIKEIHREEYFTDYSDKHFTNATCNYRGFTDN